MNPLHYCVPSKAADTLLLTLQAHFYSFVSIVEKLLDGAPTARKLAAFAKKYAGTRYAGMSAREVSGS